VNVGKTSEKDGRTEPPFFYINNILKRDTDKSVRVMQISHLVPSILFWNNLHQVRPSQKAGKPCQFKVFSSKTYTKQDRQNLLTSSAVNVGKTSEKDGRTEPPFFYINNILRHCLLD
jgi:hypothetical protein